MINTLYVWQVAHYSIFYKIRRLHSWVFLIKRKDNKRTWQKIYCSLVLNNERHSWMDTSKITYSRVLPFENGSIQLWLSSSMLWLGMNLPTWLFNSNWIFILKVILYRRLQNYLLLEILRLNLQWNVSSFYFLFTPCFTYIAHTLLPL